MIQPGMQQGQTRISPLVVGQLNQIGNTFTFIPSVVLVQDSGHNIIFDTPTSTDTASTQQMLNQLRQHGLAPDAIDILITSHGHPDHNGNDNYFLKAKHYFSGFGFSGNQYQPDTLFNNTAGTLQLTPNIVLWNTPGHTPQDISAIVRNVPNLGTVALVGDLILSANDDAQWREFAWSVPAVESNRRRVICAVNYIVPGHGAGFAVTDAMRRTAQC